MLANGNKLYFERFLNEEEKEPPDIDIDISNRTGGKWHNT
jgi:DNA polymerase III alpha subunit